MSRLKSYFDRNPITRNILVVVALFVLLIILFSFKGIEQGKLNGEILSTDQKIYGGKSIGVEDRAKVLLLNGVNITVICDESCPVGKNIEITEYLTLTGKKVYFYEGT